MRKLVFENKTALLSEKMIDSLAERFYWRNATLERGWWRISKECILCTKFKKELDCSLCPLDIFRETTEYFHNPVGCFTLINSIIPDDILNIGSGTIKWPNSRNLEAREQLDQIRNALLALPKTRRTK